MHSIEEIATSVRKIAEASENQCSPLKEADCGQRVETYITPLYIGIWLHQNGDEIAFHLEINLVDDPNTWVEDGVLRGDSVVVVAFSTFADAMRAHNDIIMHLSSDAGFNRV